MTGYTVALKLASTVPAWLRAIGARSMPLGLDLQGGVHFLMEVDQSGVVDKQENSYADDIRAYCATSKSVTSRWHAISRPAISRGAAFGQ